MRFKRWVDQPLIVFLRQRVYAQWQAGRRASGLRGVWSGWTAGVDVRREGRGRVYRRGASGEGVGMDL